MESTADITAASIESVERPARLRALARLAVLTLCCLAPACSSSDKSGSTCVVGEQLACFCPAGGSGYRVCAATGSYGDCDCSATQVEAGVPDAALASEPDAAVSLETDGGVAVDVAGMVDVLAADTSAPSALLPLYSPCTVDGQCASNFCFLYNDGKQLCTKTCVASSECPAPSSGCNAKGVCKNPM